MLMAVKNPKTRDVGKARFFAEGVWGMTELNALSLRFLMLAKPDCKIKYSLKGAVVARAGQDVAVAIAHDRQSLYQPTSSTIGVARALHPGDILEAESSVFDAIALRFRPMAEVKEYGIYKLKAEPCYPELGTNDRITLLPQGQCDENVTTLQRAFMGSMGIAVGDQDVKGLLKASRAVVHTGASGPDGFALYTPLGRGLALLGFASATSADIAEQLFEKVRETVSLTEKFGLSSGTLLASVDQSNASNVRRQCCRGFRDTGVSTKIGMIPY